MIEAPWWLHDLLLIGGTTAVIIIAIDYTWPVRKKKHDDEER